MEKIEFGLDRKISNQVAFAIILIVGFVVAWITIRIGSNIVNSFPEKNMQEMQKSYNFQGEELPFSNKPNPNGK